MAVTQQPLEHGQPKRRRPGMISGPSIERALIALIHCLAWGLVVMSVLGTFYGARGLDMPLTDPLRAVRDIFAAPILLVLAIVGQGLLSVVQWGSRHMAMNDDPRWWAGYFLSLALSVWWNWQAYYDPMIALEVPWLIAIGFVILGDMLPEFALVKK
jgi:hypothetical protein